MSTKENSFDELKLKVEAVLFSYADFVNLTDLKEFLKIDSEMLLNNALKELKDKYIQGHSFEIIEEDQKWKMQLKEEFQSIAIEVVSGTEIPQNVLKVLSVIAYEQPVTKTRLAEIIGRSVKPEVEYLFKNKFLSYEKVGIGKYYKVTKKFYDYFNIDEDDEAFRQQANKNINTYLEETQENNTKEKEENLEIEKK